MTFVNPLDKLPQVPVDYANHVIYGGVAGTAIFVVAHLAGAATPLAAAVATAVLLVVGVAKKGVDFFMGHESFAMCAAKAIVGAVWPATLLLVASL